MSGLLFWSGYPVAGLIIKREPSPTSRLNLRFAHTVERPFALALDNDPDVKMFFKIPDRFKIDTPIGAYNPDWAVYLTKNGEEKLYFILETKGSDSFMDLRTREQLKIHCGKKHFEALENGIEMQVATDWHEIKARV